MNTMQVLASHPVGDVPDVLAFDPLWRRLYVACESGVVNVFDERNKTLQSRGEVHFPHAHTIAVDPQTPLIYLPLQDIEGRPLLRIMACESPSSIER
jgi:DNA-binding beta-propeller fold protein YncE